MSVSEADYLHQIPFEMWIAYVEERRTSIETICGLELKPEIPLNDKLPRCPKCWPPRVGRPAEPRLAKLYKAKAVQIAAIQVNPEMPGQIDKVIEWGKRNDTRMTWFGVDRGLHVKTADGKSFQVPTYDYLIKDLIGNITNLPAWLFWTMYEEE